MIDQQYIEMCAKASRHIQWLPMEGQCYIRKLWIDPGNRPHYLTGGNIETVEGDNVRVTPAFNGQHDLMESCVWLPVPEECRKMIWNNMETDRNILESFNSFIYGKDYTGSRPIDDITSIEGLWLALYMQHNGFIWDNNDWRKT